MRRKKAFRRSRLIVVLLAGSAGCMAGVWHAAALRGTALSAAQTVSLRFPLDLQDRVQDSQPVRMPPAAPADTASAAVVGSSQFALLSPEPMVPQVQDPQAATPLAEVPQAEGPEAAIPQAKVPQAPVRVADAGGTTRVVMPDLAVPRRRMVTAALAAEAKSAAAPSRRHVDRPGFMLNDAQIASIKQRLHLTADQESMWPAVEAALRNIAYARARDARRNGASQAQLASADPNSAEVQGLKSAAIPLLMSFNDEQKDEVRNIVHVMGLDQLASEF